MEVVCECAVDCKFDNEVELCRFVLIFAVGAGPVPGLLLPEIFPSRIRAKAMAFCMTVHWVIGLCHLIH